MDYSVQRDGDLNVVRGDIPISDSECLSTCWAASSEKIVHDWHLADAMGASMVVGSRDACNERRAALGIPLLDTD